MKRVYIIMLLLALIAGGGYLYNSGQNGADTLTEPGIIKPDALVLAERFLPPAGFERTGAEEHSFAHYLRSLPLKPAGAAVRYYDGRTKERNVHEAVVDMDIGDRDLQQCADAVMRLRAEYLFGEKKYEDIHFNFTNGFKAEYAKWRKGFRIEVRGNNVTWVQNAVSSSENRDAEEREAEYRDFRKYLDMVFAYAGTASLEKELLPVQIKEMQTGDVFIRGGSPGHCVIVVDMAGNPRTGEKVFLLAQSYMPAQDIHILKNPAAKSSSPWYSLDAVDSAGEFETPEWSFSKKALKRFP